MTSDYKPITEEELKEMDKAATFVMGYAPNGVARDWLRLISEVRRLRSALELYATPSQWAVAWSYRGRTFTNVLFAPDRLDLRNGEGYLLARDALGWGPPIKPCDNPSCDGVKDDKTFGDAHRCFKDGRWLDDGSEM